MLSRYGRIRLKADPTSRSAERPAAAAVGFCIAACAWAVLVLAAPLAGRGTPGAAALRLSAGTYLVGSLLCHQRPERSFHLAGAQLPVCARCTALYVSGAFGLVTALAAGVIRRPRSLVSRLVGRHGWRRVLVVAALPLIASVALEWVGAWAGSNLVRAATGIPAGWATGAMVGESLSFRGKL